MALSRRQILSAAPMAAIGLISASPAKAAPNPEYRWEMAMAWPENLPGAGTGGALFARLIETMSGGRIQITVHGSGKRVPVFQIADAVGRGEIEMGHSTAYYWKDRHPACTLFSSLPFGLTPPEMLAWLEHGGGQQFWDELYARFNIKPFPAGNTGIQMGGWYNKEIEDISDFRDLKVRMPGVGGEIIHRAGATLVSVPAHEIYETLRNGTIDAAEWIAPADDLALNLHKAAKYYYWPGWHEPGTIGEGIIHKPLYDRLPKDLQCIISHAARIVYNNMRTEYTANNGAALVTLLHDPDVHLKRFNDRTLMQLARISQDLEDEIAGVDPLSRKIFDSYRSFRKQAIGWNQIGHEAYSLCRALGHPLAKNQ